MMVLMSGGVKASRRPVQTRLLMSKLSGALWSVESVRQERDRQPSAGDPSRESVDAWLALLSYNNEGTCSRMFLGRGKDKLGWIIKLRHY